MIRIVRNELKKINYWSISAASDEDGTARCPEASRMYRSILFCTPRPLPRFALGDLVKPAVDSELFSKEPESLSSELRTREVLASLRDLWTACGGLELAPAAPASAESSSKSSYNRGKKVVGPSSGSSKSLSELSSSSSSSSEGTLSEEGKLELEGVALAEFVAPGAFHSEMEERAIR